MKVEIKGVTDTKPDIDYTLTEQKDQNSDDQQVPIYQQKLELDDEQRERLTKELINHIKNLKEERQTKGLESVWTKCQNQYDGVMEDNSDAQFNCHMQTTKIKTDAVVRAAKRAFLDADPMFSSKPRPEMAKELGERADVIAQKQQDWLDYQFDEGIDIAEPLELALYSAAIKVVGILKMPWKHLVKNKRREETYEGKIVIVGVDPQGNPKIDNPGLKEFLQNYPDAPKKYPGFVKRLENGETVRILAEYEETVYNNPNPKHVENENFYVYDHVQGIRGLAETPIVVERDFYSWSELLSKQESEGWENIEQIKFKGSALNSNDKDAKLKEDYEIKDHSIFEINYMFNLKNTGKVSDEVKVKCFFAEEREVLLCCVNYPYYGIDCEYIPFYIKKNRGGFWKDGKSFVLDMAPSNLAENMFLNFALEGVYASNTITPVVKEGSVTERQILEKRWTHGVPLSVRKDAQEVGKEITFLPKPQVNLGEMMNMLQYLVKQDDDVTGVTSLMTGRESPTDPRAPATKTLALLKTSGMNIEDYIRTLLPSFNEIANVMLQLYHQMSNDTTSFRVKSSLRKTTGENPFDDISRSDMIAKTNIQSQAFSFDFDKQAKKQEAIALYQILRPELLLRGDYQGLYELVRIIIKSWGPMWNSKVDSIWPTPEEFQQMEVQDTVAGLAQYVEGLLAKEQATGVPAQPQADKAMAMLQQLTSARMSGQDLGGSNDEKKVNVAMGVA